jgi:hypothetical protein
MLRPNNLNSIKKPLTLVQVFLICSFEFLILLFISSKYIFENDEGIWSYIGRVWHRNNLLPYIHTVENKTPFIYYLHYMSDFLFGVNFYFVRFLGIVAVLLTSHVLYRIMSLILNMYAGIIASILYCLIMTWQIVDGATMGSTEVFMNLFSITGLYYIILYFKTNVVLNILKSGFYFCLAIQTKQIAIITLVGVFIYLLFYSHNKNNGILKQIILLFLGLIIGFILTFIPLYLSNISLSDYVNGAWFILLNPGSSLNTFQGRINSFIEIFIGTKLFLISIVFLLLLFFKFENVQKRYKHFFVLIFIFEFIAINASGTYSGHQLKQIIPILTIFLSIIFNNLFFSDRFNKWSFKKFLYFLILLFFPYDQMLNSLYFNYKNKHKSYIESVNLRDYINLHYSSERYIYIFGNCKTINPILAISERLSPIKNFNNYFLRTKIDLIQASINFKKNPPNIIFVEKDFNIYSNYGSDIYYFINNTYDYKAFKEGFSILEKKN